ncbi:MAG: hypothetical protein DELT_01463 [Desulfovibrio sp.]
MTVEHQCLFCNAPLKHLFVDLATCPPSNAFLTVEQCEEPEIFYPLRVYVCEKCLLVQSPFYKQPQDIFDHDYVYHSSWSSSWGNHAKAYVEKVCERFGFDSNSLIIEVGSNDGYLLQHVLEKKIPCIGIDPSTGAASIAQAKGIFTITDFFTEELGLTLAKAGKQADLICGINVFAHVPNVNNFIAGIAALLKKQGVATMEFPHLLRLIEEVQFDTIYHEHYFYYSLHIVQKMLAAHGLRIFDVEQLPTHGGSLRVYACREEAHHKDCPAIRALLEEEKNAGMSDIQFYTGFQKRIFSIRCDVMRFLLDAMEQNKSVIGYGAAAKGNTLINFFGIRKDLLPFVVDASPTKQGKFLPGSRIPVYSPDIIRETKPDYLLVLPWNLIDEITEQHSYVREWGGKFVRVIPRLEVT